MVGRSLSELKNGEKQPIVKAVNLKKVSEIDAILTDSATGVIAPVERSVEACAYMELWFHPKEEDLSAGSSNITVKFYKKFGDESVLAETVTVSNPALTKATAGKIDIETVDADMDSYDTYKIEGTISLASGGTISLRVGKKTQG